MEMQNESLQMWFRYYPWLVHGLGIVRYAGSSILSNLSHYLAMMRTKTALATDEGELAIGNPPFLKISKESILQAG